MHDGLEDHGRDLVAVPLELLGEIGDVALFEGLLVAAARALGKIVVRQHAMEEIVHAVYGVTHRHRGEGVAVVTAADGEQAAFFGPAECEPVLQRQFDRDLHGHGTRVAEKDALEITRRQLHQPLAERDGGFVGEAAEHHVRHAFELAAHCGLDVRVPVAMDAGPPGRHAVDQLAPVGQPQPHALRRRDLEEGRGLGRRVGMPHSLVIALDQVHEESRVMRPRCRFECTLSLRTSTNNAG